MNACRPGNRQSPEASRPFPLRERRAPLFDEGAWIPGGKVRNRFGQRNAPCMKILLINQRNGAGIVAG